MRQRDRFSRDLDSDDGLFFDDEHDGHHEEHHDDYDDDRPRAADRSPDAADDRADTSPAPSPVGRQSRVERHRAQRRRGRRRVAWVFAALLVLVLGLATWLVVLPVYHYLNPANYDGTGSGSVVVTVLADDGATAIADELKDKGVVASVRAFTDAADNNTRSRSIQPGTYRLREHMSGAAALDLMLDPSSRLHDDVVVTEGATTLQVRQRLIAKPCSSTSDASALCGPGYSATAVAKAFADVSALGVPTDFRVGGKTPSSVEGFLYPATYFFPEDGRPADALQQMITKFAEQLRDTDFITRAKVNGLTPYQQLIAASIAQSEAKYPADMAKVVRTILNRIHAGMPLQSDATSAYGARLQGLDLSKVIYAQLDSPYNSYTHHGLPPTPISNPGADALNGAAHPPAGNYLYFVTDDAAGHLFFTNSYAQFQAKSKICAQHNWGCG